METNDKRHGSYAGYIAGCNRREMCPLSYTCVDAERKYQNDYNRDRAYGRPRKVPSIGSVRRLQALMAIGWSGTYLSERLGYRRTNLPTHTRYPTIRTPKAQAIADLYVELLQAEPHGPSERTRLRAQRAGFPPPSAWEGVDIDDPDAVCDYAYQYEVEQEAEADVDPIVVERVLVGEDLPMTKAERLEVVRVLAARGWTPTAIGKRVAMNSARVAQLLERLTAAA